MNTGRGTWRARALASLAILSALVLTGCNDFFAAGWGNNEYAQLGSGTTTNSSTPVDVSTETALLDKVVTQVDAGLWDSCATTVDGTGACWGAKRPVPLDPSYVLRPEAIPTNGVLSAKTVTKTAAGTTERCALTSDGTVGCWRPDTPVPFSLGGLLDVDDVVQLEIRPNYKCVLTASGYLACGGLMGEGILSQTGALVGKTVVQLAKSGSSMCALTDDNVIACWGANFSGQLGDGTTNNSYWVAVPVVQNKAMAGKTIVALAHGTGQHMCAVASDGSAFCWGANESGQLGNGNTTGSTEPVQVAQVGALAGRGVQQMSFGIDHTCAILDDESMACWGDNASGQLGNGTTDASLQPVPVNPMPDAGGQPRPIVASTSGLDYNLAVYQEQTPSQYVPVTPQRVVDTRAGGGAPVGPGGQLLFSVAAVVPEGATAISYNLTATGQTASGAAALVPDGSAATAVQTSVINWSSAQQTIANGFLVQVPVNRQLEIKLNSTGSSHFVVDVTGYFVPPGNPEANLYHPSDERIYDSRDGDGPLGPGQSRLLNVAGGPGMTEGDAGVTDSWPMQAMSGSTAAAAVNVTVTGTLGSGVMSVAKDVSTTTSTVNWTGPSQTVANAVITGVAADGSFRVTNNGGTAADVVVDLTGLFLPPNVAGGAAFFPMTPDRAYDSRSTNGLLAAGQSRGNTFPVPVDAVAVALNTTITGTSGTGYLSVTPPPFSTLPTTSMVNWFASPTTRANGAIVPVERTAARAYTGGNFSTQYLYDTAGFFR